MNGELTDILDLPPIIRIQFLCVISQILALFNKKGLITKNY